MKIGVVIACHEAAEYFEEFLAPWFEYKKKHGDLWLSAVHSTFKEYHELGRPIVSTDNTEQLLKDKNNSEEIDYVSILTEPVEEARARNVALTPLLDQKIDYLMILDPDEIYTLEQIEKIFKFVQSNPFAVWFKINFKNYIIDKNHYIDDFCPSRIFKAENLAEFIYDNDVSYLSSVDASSLVRIDYRNFSNLIIPKNIAFVTHYSWVGSPEKLKRKIAYNQAHFVDGFCSYQWNEKENKLEFNRDYYAKHNIPIPTLYEEK